MADSSTSSLISEVESYFGLPTGLLGAVVQTESSGNPKARGKAGERGLMQIMPNTAKDYGVTDANKLDDAKTNLYTGGAHLSKLLKRFDGDIPKALETYNAGRPTPKAEGYVNRVFGHWGYDPLALMGEAPAKKDATPAEDEGMKVPLLMRKTTSAAGEDITAPTPEETPKKPKAAMPDLTVPIMESRKPVAPMPLTGPTGVPAAPGPTLEIPPLAAKPPTTATGPTLEVPPVTAGAAPPPLAAAPTTPPVAPTVPPAPLSAPIVGQPAATPPASPPSGGVVGALGVAPAGAAELPPLVLAKITKAGKVTGYKLTDGSIARGVIKDASGKITGYKLADGSIRRLGGAESPGAPEISSDIPRRIEAGGQEVNRMVGFGLGALGGAATGVPGGEEVGAGVGATGADVLNAFMNHWMHGTPLNISPKTLAQDVGINALAAKLGKSVTELLTMAGVPAVEYMTGREGVKAGAKEAAAAAARTASKAEARQGAANLAATAKADLATQTALSKQAYETAQAEGDAASAKAADQMRDLLKGQYAPEARQEAIQGSLGRTPAETQAAMDAPPEITAEGVQLPGRGFVSRRQRFYDAVYAAIRKISDAMGAKYQELFKDWYDKELPGGKAAESVAQERAYIQAKGGRYTPKVEKLLSDVETLSSAQLKSPDEMSDWEAVAQVYGAKEATRLQKGSASTLARWAKSAREVLTPARPVTSIVGRAPEQPQPQQTIREWLGLPQSTKDEPISPEAKAFLKMSGLPETKEAEEAWLDSPAKPIAPVPRTAMVGGEAGLGMAGPEAGGISPTVRRWLAQRSEAVALAKSEDGPSRAAAQSIAEAIDETLADSGVPGAKELNAQYASTKRMFDKAFRRQVGDIVEPIDAAPAIFNEPQRAARIIGNADPAQKAELKRLYADWVNRDGAKVIDPALHRQTLKQLFPGTPLADPANWIHMDKNLVKIADVIESNPALKKRYFADVAKEMDRIRLDTATDLKNQALKECDKLGPAGLALRREIEGKPPAEAVAIATKTFSGLTPEQVVQQFGRSLKSPEAAGREAIGGMDVPAATKSGQPIQPATDPRQAAINALRSGKLGASPHGLDWVKRRAPLYIAYAATGAASGFITMMATVGGVVGVKELLQRNLMSRLEDEAAATAFYDAMVNPSSGSGWRTLTRAGAESAIDDALSRMGQHAARKVTGENPTLEAAPR